ncbi:hypothetical protein TRFO_20492 [Tritrichomonas foetus]|uniref:Uncharacterized protein n=1 Tax=Tritrichomonas foetus TaxID=1144522 RepID=A0A1J4KFK8_9EUKA|nr:hypothetical protein TRFO_20492 [Tritrichomonas foetus]|eukprot:OHT10209.1 hypothetical protein TRFO_20492 [Tritrichomonas foetus]
MDSSSINDVDEALNSDQLISVQVDTHSVKEVLTELSVRLENAHQQISTLQEMKEINDINDRLDKLVEQMESVQLRSARPRISEGANIEDITEELDKQFEELRSKLQKMIDDSKSAQRPEIERMIDNAIESYKKENLQFIANAFPSMTLYNSLLARVEDLEAGSRSTSKKDSRKEDKPRQLTSTRANEFLEQLQVMQNQIEMMKKRIGDTDMHQSEFQSKFLNVLKRIDDQEDKLEKSDRTLFVVEEKLNLHQEESEKRLKALEDLTLNLSNNANNTKVATNEILKEIETKSGNVSEDAATIISKMMPLISELQEKQIILESKVKEQDEIIKNLKESNMTIANRSKPPSTVPSPSHNNKPVVTFAIAESDPLYVNNQSSNKVKDDNKLFGNARERNFIRNTSFTRFDHPAHSKKNLTFSTNTPPNGTASPKTPLSMTNTPRDHQSFKELSHHLNDTDTKLTELENEIINLKAVVEDLNNGVKSEIVLTTNTESQDPDVQQDNMANSSKPEEPGSQQVQQSNQPGARKSELLAGNSIIRTLSSSSLRSKSAAKSNLFETPSKQPTKTITETAPKEPPQQQNISETTNNNNNNQQCIEKTEVNEDVIQTNSPNNEEEDHPIDDFTIDDFGNLSRHVASLEMRVNALENRSPVRFMSPEDSPFGSTGGSRALTPVSAVESPQRSLNSEVPSSVQNSSNSSSNNQTPNESNNQSNITDKRPGSSVETQSNGNAETSTSKTVSTTESPPKPATNNRKVTFNSRSVQTYEDTECQVVFTDDRATSPAATSNKESSKSDSLAPANATQPNIDEERMARSNFISNEQQSSVSDDAPLSSARLESEPETQPKGKTMELRLSTPVHDDISAQRTPHSRNTSSRGNSSAMYDELNKNLDEVKGTVARLEEEIKSKQDLQTVSKENPDFITNILDQVRFEVDQRLMGLTPKVVQDLNSFAPLPVVKKIAENFQISIDELDSQIAHVKEFLKNLVTRNDLDAMMDKLNVGDNASGNTAGARLALRCLLCGKPASCVTGMITESEMARLLGTPPQCGISAAKTRNSTNTNYVLTYGRGTAYSLNKKTAKLKTAQLPPMDPPTTSSS